MGEKWWLFNAPGWMLVARYWSLLSQEFLKKVSKSGIVENLLSWENFKQSKDLMKTDGTKRQRITGNTKLEDANDAGGKSSDKCTLILTEGVSAKALAGKQKRNNRKVKDKGRDDKSGVTIQDILQEESLADERKDFTIEDAELVLENSDVFDSVDCLPEMQPDSEDRDTDTSEVHPPTEASSSVVSGLSAGQNGIRQTNSLSIVDDSSSTCSTDSVPSVVMNGSYKGYSLPNHKKQKSPSRERNQRGKATCDATNLANEDCILAPEPSRDVAQPNDASESCKAKSESETVVYSLQDRIKKLEQHVVKMVVNTFRGSCFGDGIFSCTESCSCSPIACWQGQTGLMVSAYLVYSGMSAKEALQVYAHKRTTNNEGAESVRASLAGKHVVVATMTSSGKSLCYNLPVLEVLSQNLLACALYLFPTKDPVLAMAFSVARRAAAVPLLLVNGTYMKNVRSYLDSTILQHQLQRLNDHGSLKGVRVGFLKLVVTFNGCWVARITNLEHKFSMYKISCATLVLIATQHQTLAAVSIPSQRRYVGYWENTLSIPRGVDHGPPSVNSPEPCSRELVRIRLYDMVNTGSVFFVVSELQEVPGQRYCPPVEVFKSCCREVKKGCVRPNSSRYYLSFVDQGGEGNRSEPVEPHLVVQMDTESSVLYQKTCLDYCFEKPIKVPYITTALMDAKAARIFLIGYQGNLVD
ncbi:hypothetical protein TEA_019490 [Camellia sinensis var. sinensis]|uniref:DEAD/DEAH-box helicase domain-containing protein n=1 Tax=Camellia sinensis var. sinensis TaxID=542762 RepID=A0A4S4ENH7_CAMSN|nr:hypothetical protein TEA_019490 [Camellia sinensis var. sinensis]